MRDHSSRKCNNRSSKSPVTRFRASSQGIANRAHKIARFRYAEPLPRPKKTI